MTPPPADPVVVYGAGDHGLVVAETAEALGLRVLGFLDDADAAAAGRWPVLSPDAPGLNAAAFIVAIGDNAARGRVLDTLTDAGRPLTTLVHPTAFVSGSARLGRGVWIGPHAIVHSRATVGDGAIINSGAVVEHHNVIGRCAHVAPGCVLGGRVTVGDGSLVGLGARVLPGAAIGTGCVVGAGAVVLGDVGDGQTVVGVPALNGSQQHHHVARDGPVLTQGVDALVRLALDVHL